ncbi:MAG TPA: TetR family transcriptional regulator C-terminal domain-containing protein [Gemmatimonadaceae bacterium]|nr:TetR family transcriptional regulator C-terminal domain-containing protein [Gemmatimonadaceae bacterium]
MNDRRTRIVEAATDLICRNGFQHTSVDDVIREAGLCGKAHFYHYFKSKEELGYAVVQHRFEQFAEEGLSILRDPMVDPLERLERFIDAEVASQAEQDCRGGCPFGNLVTEMADAHEGFRQRLATVFERWAGQLQSVLWEARPQLRDDADIARMARFIIATLEGGLLMSRVTRDVTHMEAIAGDLKRFINAQRRETPAVSVGP